MTSNSQSGRRFRPALARFVSTGIIATSTHTVIVLALVHWHGWAAGGANFAAFILATLVSYVLNSWWTFSASMTRRNAGRFVLVATSCATLAAVLADVAARFGYGTLVGIALVVIVTTPISFFLHKNWTYHA